MSQALWAEVSINTNEVEIRNFEIEYFIDDSKEMNLSAIQQATFTPTSNRKVLASDATNIWVRIKIRNTTSLSQDIFLHNSAGYVYKELEFYELQKHKETKYTYANLEKNIGMELIHGSDFIYQLRLDANQDTILYIRLETFAYQYFEFLIFDKQNSQKELIGKHLISLVLVSMLLALVFYNILFYFSTKFKDYLYYSTYIFFIVIWTGYEFGLFAHYFGILEANGMILNFAVVFGNIFMFLFVQVLLNTKQNYPKEHKWLNIIIIAFIFNLLTIPYDLYFALEFFMLTGIIIIMVYIPIGISIYRKRDPYIKYLGLGQFIVVLFGIVSQLFYEGLIDYNFFTRRSFGLGVILEAFLFSYLLSYRIKQLQENQRIAKEQNIFYDDKLKALNQLLDNIAHQWKQPLSQINTSIMIVDIELQKHKFHSTTVEKRLNDIENFSHYLSQTIDDFKSIYDNRQIKSEFNLSQTIQDSFTTIEAIYERYKIEIIWEFDSSIVVESYANHLQQVILIILNNAKDALMEAHIQNPKVYISTYRDSKSATIKIADNGGGVDAKIEERLFEPNFSTKVDGQGIGLYMARKIVVELMGGELGFENRDNGVCFFIKLDLMQN